MTKKNIIICGAPRAGTTSLYRYLLDHDQVGGSSTKELSYFLGGSAESDCFKSEHANETTYWSIFPGTEFSHSLEASPIYMHTNVTSIIASRISSTLRNPKLVFLLRSPVERFVSHFNVDKRVGKVSAETTLAQYIELCLADDESVAAKDSLDGRVALSIGCYAEALKVYNDKFGEEGMYCMFTESLASNPQNELVLLSDFLDLDSSQFVSKKYSIENQYRNTKSKHLYIVAGKFNKRFERMLNRFPQIRNKTRMVYNMVNTSDSYDSKADVDSYKYLARYYEAHNDALRTLLIDMGLELRLPNWLKKDI